MDFEGISNYTARNMESGILLMVYRHMAPLRVNLFWTFLLLCSLAPDAVSAQTRQFQNLTLTPSTVSRYDRVTVTFTLDKAYSNPYDPDIVDASVVFTVNNSLTRSIPAFWNAAPGITPRWEARLCADHPGRTALNVVVRDADGRSVSDELGFFTNPDGGKGFIRTDARNSKYMRFDRGEPYIPVGHNICWGNLNQYNDWIPKMKAAGENWGRLWINSYIGRGLEWANGVDDYQGIGRYSQRNADHFDKVFNLAAANEIYLQLAMDSFNSWNYNVYSDWAGNPYNTARGGWLDTPDKYFTDPLAFKWALKKHRYIVARWAYSPNVLCWEFFNEADGTHNFRNQRPAALDWHRRQARHIRKLDPYNHYITTSFTNDGSTDVYYPEFWQAPEMELVQTHRYSDNLPDSHVTLIKNAQRFGKPEIHSEFGKEDVPTKPMSRYDSSIQDSDPTGERLHDMIWAAAMSESGAMSWWWDGWIGPRNLYSVFAPLTRFLAGQDLADKGLRQEGIAMASQHPAKVFGMRGPKHAYVWVDYRGTGQAVDLKVELTGVVNESFYVDYYNTYQYALVEQAIEQAVSGRVTLDVPPFERDIAVMMRPFEPQSTPTPTLSPTPWPTFTPTITSTPRPGDFTADGRINAYDLFTFAENWHNETSSALDLLPDNFIDEGDLLRFLGIYEVMNETGY